jgi:hypothetical protein
VFEPKSEGVGSLKGVPLKGAMQELTHRHVMRCRSRVDGAAERRTDLRGGGKVEIRGMGEDVLENVIELV